MKVAICAGPPTSGKSTVLKQTIKRILSRGDRVAFLKVDVQFADEDEIFKEAFNIPTRKVYSGELCPDHCNVLIMDEAIEWAKKEKVDFLLVETAGLCLRCSPYIEGALGIVVLEATSGMNLPRKIGPMLTLSDLAVVTKIDLVSQAEREVFRARVMEVATNILVAEADALHGIGIDPIVNKLYEIDKVGPTRYLRGSPPVGTCSVCVGKKEIGWKHHFGVLKPLEGEIFYRGE